MIPNYQIEAGAKMLDKKVPGWHHRISIQTLDLESSANCILGQLFGTLPKALAKLNLRSLWEYGFNVSLDIPGDEYGSAFENLKPLWIEQIFFRRMTGLAKDLEESIRRKQRGTNA